MKGGLFRKITLAEEGSEDSLGGSDLREGGGGETTLENKGGEEEGT